MSARSTCDAFIPHVGWLRHECGEEVISLLRQGYFEAAEQAFFWLHARPGDVFIDGGAHIGLYSIITHRAAGGDARIIAVEPSEATAEHLAGNLRANGVSDPVLVRAALWREAGDVRFAAQTQGKAAYAHVDFEGASESRVAATTLDEIVEGSRAPQIALAKLDVEGAEPEALQGGSRAIARGALPLLMVEFTERNLQGRGSSSAALRGQLEALGYVLAELDTTALQLTPFAAEGPIWFRNLFACADLAATNARLAAASSINRTIARDILDRAAACNRFRELEELDRLRAVEAEGSRVRAWAEDADARALAASRLAEERTEWAERSDRMLADARVEVDAQRAESVRLNDDLALVSGKLLALQATTQPLRNLAARYPRLARFILRWLQ